MHQVEKVRFRIISLQDQADLKMKEDQEDDLELVLIDLEEIDQEEGITIDLDLEDLLQVWIEMIQPETHMLGIREDLTHMIIEHKILMQEIPDPMIHMHETLEGLTHMHETLEHKIHIIEIQEEWIHILEIHDQTILTLEIYEELILMPETQEGLILMLPEEGIHMGDMEEILEIDLLLVIEDLVQEDHQIVDSLIKEMISDEVIRMKDIEITNLKIQQGF